MILSRRFIALYTNHLFHDYRKTKKNKKSDLEVEMLLVWKLLVASSQLCHQSLQLYVFIGKHYDVNQTLQEQERQRLPD
jgi:hypothetical protein